MMPNQKYSQDFSVGNFEAYSEPVYLRAVAEALLRELIWGPVRLAHPDLSTSLR